MNLNTVRQSLKSIIKLQIQYNFKMKYSTENVSNKYKMLSVSVPKQFVYLVQLNRPEKLNALNNDMWKEFTTCFDDLAVDPECRVIILSAVGKAFCAGIDMHDMVKLGQQLAEHEDVARKCKILQQKIRDYQDSFTAIEKCPKPVIAAVHGACIGGGIDMISAVDIRYSTSDAWFQIKEVDIGMAADVGTLQRFPKIVGSDSLARELVYTARKFTPSEALQCGFVSRVFDSQESLMDNSMKLAEVIASKSPVAVQGSKINLIYSRDHSVQESLDYIAVHNQAMLQSEDLVNATMAQISKGHPPIFSKL